MTLFRPMNDRITFDAPPVLHDPIANKRRDNVNHLSAVHQPVHSDSISNDPSYRVRTSLNSIDLCQCIPGVTNHSNLQSLPVTTVYRSGRSPFGRRLYAHPDCRLGFLRRKLSRACVVACSSRPCVNILMSIEPFSTSIPPILPEHGPAPVWQSTTSRIAGMPSSRYIRPLAQAIHGAA